MIKARGGWPWLMLGSAFLAFWLIAAACDEDNAGREVDGVPGGDPGRGAGIIESFGCGSCHGIPGIDGANGTVGPPLDQFAERDFIAGEVPNTAENLIAWLRDPQSIEPGTVMPDVGLSEAQAQDVAAYLETLD